MKTKIEVFRKHWESFKKEQANFNSEHRNKFIIRRCCSGCEKLISEDDIYFIGINNLGLWYNCNHCGSTMLTKNINSCLKVNTPASRHDLIKLLKVT